MWQTFLSDPFQCQACDKHLYHFDSMCQPSVRQSQPILDQTLKLKKNPSILARMRWQKKSYASASLKPISKPIQQLEFKYAILLFFKVQVFCQLGCKLRIT
jgi:hypothetical protein